MPPYSIGRLAVMDNRAALPGEDHLDHLLQRPHGGDRKSEEAKKIKIDNVNLDPPKSPTGTSSSAALRRLRKHRPDLHKKVLETI